MQTRKFTNVIKITFIAFISIAIIATLQSCARKLTFLPSSETPAATGKVKIKKDNNNNYRNGSKETGIYRNHKDGVAYKLFSGKKESLSLYNSIMRTDYTDPDELEVVTLNSAIYIGRKNDNAIILHFNMLLTEFQTTFNPNMPLRTLIYVSNEYEKYIAEHESNLYSEYIQKIEAKCD